MKKLGSSASGTTWLLGLALVGTDFLPPRAGPAVLARDAKLGVAVVDMTPALEKEIGRLAHEKGRCGGYEMISPKEISVLESSTSKPAQARALLKDLQTVTQAHFRAAERVRNRPLLRRANVDSALDRISASRLGETLQWYSSFPTRFNRSPDANVPVEALKAKLQEIVRGQNGVTVELVSHTSTPQKSVRVRLPGRTRPNEVLVLGGHLDSIVGGFGGGGGKAPGADDNASGVASLTEALRVLVTQPRPERSVEFFFYAGEESGLLGSAEIATDYKNRNVDVVAVLQLDMTLFPGSGANTLASMTDFTSPWLREVLVQINDNYLKAKIIEDKCGYGCSDHASWYRKGFSTLMPFEATFRDMNRNIHTTRDVIDSRSDFAHSAIFAKIALALALELGNSTHRGPAPVASNAKLAQAR